MTNHENDKYKESIEKSFTKAHQDALMYGCGYVRLNRDMEVDHVSPDQLYKELQDMNELLFKDFKFIKKDKNEPQE